jgi:hypothetical protein
MRDFATSVTMSLLQGMSCCLSIFVHEVHAVHWKAAVTLIAGPSAIALTLRRE